MKLKLEIKTRALADLPETFKNLANFIYINATRPNTADI